MFGSDLHLAAFAEELRQAEPEMPADAAVFLAEKQWPYKAVSVAAKTLGEVLEVQARVAVQRLTALFRR
jgi:hypothetical protein